MDTHLELIGDANGIPVYHRYFDQMGHVALRLILFVGGADDPVGQEGLGHWREHISFAGTDRFPNGYLDTMARFAGVRGIVRASTGTYMTNYRAVVPSAYSKEALNLLVDLATAPLATEAGFTSERKIILQENRQRESDWQQYVSLHYRGLLMPGHPTCRSIIGDETTLIATKPEAVRRMFKEEHSAERTVLLIAGGIGEGRALREAERHLSRIPHHEHLVRRRMTRYERPLAEWGIAPVAVREYPFKSSSIVLFFPIHLEGTDIERAAALSLLASTLTVGDLGSPLYRHLREERQLCYAAQATDVFEPHFEGLQLFISCKPGDEDHVASECMDLLRLPELRSGTRRELVNDWIVAYQAMEVPSPEDSCASAETDLLLFGEIIPDMDFAMTKTHVRQEQLLEMLDSIAASTPICTQFRGIIG